MMAKRRAQRLILSGIISILTAPRCYAGYTLNTLASFNGADGQSIFAGVTVISNTIYGTAYSGGANGDGTLFSLPIIGGMPTVLATFNASGSHPYGDLTFSNGIFYGAANGGGTSGSGAVFSFPIAGGSQTILASLAGTATGEGPTAGLVLSGGTLYGSTYSGGPGFGGAVFSLPANGGAVTLLASFNSSTGTNLNGGLTLQGSTLYGTTLVGGANNDGTVFSIPISGGTPTVLASFNNSNGRASHSTLTLSGNTLYGATTDGGPNGDGVIFSVPTTGGTPTVIASFNGSDGAGPQAQLTLIGNTLYGTTTSGGAFGDGTVFSVPVSGGSPSVLVSFNASNGSSPHSSLAVVGNAFYGTTAGGGANSLGSVFSLTPNPILSVTVAAPTAFGLPVGTLAISGGIGKYNVSSATFPATSTGYLSVTGFNPATDTEVYAVELIDSIPADLSIDLADAASEINAATYAGYSIAASTTDPTGTFGAGYDLFIAVTHSSLGTGSPYFGFDFSQLNNNTGSLSVTATATGGSVPEPSGILFFAIAGIGMLRRRRNAHVANDHAQMPRRREECQACGLKDLQSRKFATRATWTYRLRQLQEASKGEHSKRAPAL